MVYQSHLDDCGKSCVRNLLCLLYKNDGMSIEPLLSDCKNFYSIREELSRFEISYASFQVNDFSEVKASQLPAICLFKQNEKSHFVILRKIFFNRYFILDPNFGEYVLSKEEFLYFYQGKALLKEEKTKKGKPQKITLLNRREKMSFFLSLLCNLIFSLCFIFTILSENAFHYSVFCLVGIVLLLLLENGEASCIEKRLDKELLQPYMKEFKNKDDFPLLSSIITREIKQRIGFISYFTMCVITFFLFAINSFYLTFLCIVPIFFFFIKLKLKKEKNKVNLFCSLKEEKYLSELNLNYDLANRYYIDARRQSRKYFKEAITTTIVMTITELLFILFALYLKNSIEVNLLFFYMTLSITLDMSLEKLYFYLFEQKERTCEINQLSYPLKLFLLKTSRELKYNKKDIGDPCNGKREAKNGISRPDEAEARPKKDI